MHTRHVIPLDVVVGHAGARFPEPPKRGPSHHFYTLPLGCTLSRSVQC